MADTFPTCRNSVKESYGKQNRQTAQYKKLGFHKSKKVKGMFKHRLKLDFADDEL